VLNPTLVSPLAGAKGGFGFEVFNFKANVNLLSGRFFNGKNN